MVCATIEMEGTVGVSLAHTSHAQRCRGAAHCLAPAHSSDRVASGIGSHQQRPDSTIQRSVKVSHTIG